MRGIEGLMSYLFQFMSLPFPSRRDPLSCKDIYFCPIYNQLFCIIFFACCFSLPRKLFSFNILKATDRLSHS